MLLQYVKCKIHLQKEILYQKNTRKRLLISLFKLGPSVCDRYHWVWKYTSGSWASASQLTVPPWLVELCVACISLQVTLPLQLSAGNCFWLTPSRSCQEHGDNSGSLRTRVATWNSVKPLFLQWKVHILFIRFKVLEIKPGISCSLPEGIQQRCFSQVSFKNITGKKKLFPLAAATRWPLSTQCLCACTFTHVSDMWH